MKRTLYTWAHEDGYIKRFYKTKTLLAFVRKFLTETDLKNSVVTRHKDGLRYVGAWIRTTRGYSIKF